MKYLKLIRAKHYIKNGLVFVPLLFSGTLFSWGNPFWHTVIGAVIFCLVSSIMYIINDIKDVQKDRLHPVKCKRPIASGDVSIPTGSLVAVILGIGATLLSSLLLCSVPPWSFLFLLVYFLLNLGYSLGLKNKPLVEIAILASGFVLRVLFGGAISEVTVSGWLYLTVMAISFYLGLGKRRNELERHGKGGTRKVLRYYSHSFLDKNMYMFLALSICFYSLWALEHPKPLMLWSIPVVMLISMRYSLRVEGATEGDPVDIILKDKTLMALGALYAMFILFVLYGS